MSWIWPKHFWRRMFQWGPKGNCYGPQPAGVDYEEAQRYFGLRAEQLAHNLHDDWNVDFVTATRMVRQTMAELFRQLDVNHGAV